eukprot:COSAG06_NODE_350_length_16971_cov_14.110927_3_plen_83_part_00
MRLSKNEGLSFSSDFGSADLTARAKASHATLRDATRPRVRPLLRLSPPPSSAMATSMAGVTGIPGQIVRGKYPLIELVPGGM